MQLTLYADYSLRALLYLAEHPGRPVTTQEISQAYGISRHHLVRVMHNLAEHSLITVSAGRKGGALLGRAPKEINLGHVLRATEKSLALVECFDPATNTCPIAATCTLQGVLGEALGEFLAVLDRHTLADVVGGHTGLLQITSQITTKITPSKITP